MSNCKIGASAKTLLQYYPDDLEESLPEEITNSFFYIDKTTPF